MERFVLVTVFAGVITLPALGIGQVAGAARIESEPQNMIQVCVLDYAGIQASLLEDARQVTEEIYSDAGIDLEWLPLDASASGRLFCDGPVGPSLLSLRLLPSSMAKGLPSYDTVFGVAPLSKDNQHASIAYIFVDRIADHADYESVSWPELLGFVMAHEMGHLLLGTNSHSRHGIMRSRWNRVVLDRTHTATQRFLREQKRSIQDHVRARIQSSRNRAGAKGAADAS